MTSAIEAFSFKIDRFGAWDILKYVNLQWNDINVDKILRNSFSIPWMSESNRTDAISADKIAIFEWLFDETAFEEMWNISKNETLFNLIRYNYFWKCSKLSIDPNISIISVFCFWYSGHLAGDSFSRMNQVSRIENNPAWRHCPHEDSFVR